MSTANPHLGDWEPASDLLQDRIILVTGAASGIGRALVGSCAAHGATVVLLDRDVHGLEQAYDAIVAAGDPEPAIYPMDLQGASPDDYSALADILAREFGRLDGLVHNAAQLGALVPFANFEHELWFQTLQTNLNAPYLLTTACLGLLNNSRDASLVFTSDAVGRRGKAYWGAYAVSKAGLECFMQVLADELQANSPVRANSIDPGPVRSAMRKLAYPAEDNGTLNAPGDVVKPFLYLLGPDSRGVTGRQLSVAEMLQKDSR